MGEYVENRSFYGQRISHEAWFKSVFVLAERKRILQRKAGRGLQVFEKRYLHSSGDKSRCN